MRVQVEQVIEMMHRSHGLDISSFEASFLAKSFESQCKMMAGRSAANYLAILAGDRAKAEAFSRILLVSYSEFFRDSLTFSLLEQQILPALLQQQAHTGRNALRIWSAGCAAGQEACSLAMLLDELCAVHGKPNSFRILATDISDEALAAARAGVYTASEIQQVRLKQLDACFHRQGESFVIAPRIMARVDFSRYDLLDAGTICPPASIYGGFDLIMCCNVLIYYQPEAQRCILDKLRGCLTNGGYLITGASERHMVQNASGLREVAPVSAVFRNATRKGDL